MSERSRLRLVVLQVLVLSLLVTLFGRLSYLQVVAGEEHQRAAADNRTREVVVPAVRGQILDDRGRPLARNRTAMVVSVSRSALLGQPDRGKQMLRRLASVVDLPYDEVRGRTLLCGATGAPEPPTCWNGSPYQPIPVTDEADTGMAMQILERQEDFPGVTAELRAVREYPQPVGANAAHLIGYLGRVSDAELAAAGPGSVLQGSDLVGRAGLERQYDEQLRGTPGARRLTVDHRGAVTSTAGETDPVAGHHVVTSIDAEVQAVVERELREAIERARTEGDPNKDGKRFAADSGAAVVLDVRTGRVVAMASWPTYDPNVWVDGITDREYDAITSEANGSPIISRAFQGEYAPASTFKVVTLPAAVRAGYPLDRNYPCPSAYPIGGTLKTNYESQGYGTISMERAMEVSCDTVFYKFAHETWQRQGGATLREGVRDPFHAVAREFGLGSPTGIDLPGERGGRIPDRAWKRAHWEQTRDFHCEKARTGFPQVADEDPRRARYLRQLSRESCADGFRYRGGDAANFAIGQGDVLVTPLQMAQVYASIANGGTLWKPQVATAIMRPDGTVVRRIARERAGRAPVDPPTLRWLQHALTEVTEEGSGRGPFARAGFPLGEIPVASKTGTGEVYGKQTTSWFASYAPADDPQYAVVVMISQGGTGSGTAGPAVAGIYQELFGVRGSSVDPAAAAIPGGAPPSQLPEIRPDGTVVTPANGSRPAGGR